MNNLLKHKKIILLTLLLLTGFLVIIFLLKKEDTVYTNLNETVDFVDIAEFNIGEYITPKNNSLYTYFSYDEDDVNNAVFYINKIKIDKKDDLLHLKAVMSDFTEYEELYQVNSDQVVSLGKSYINTRENLIDNYKKEPANNLFEENINNIILQAPFELNRAWAYSETAVSEITSLNTLIELPFGDFSAIEIQTSFSDGRFRSDYYAKHLGLIKTIISDASVGTNKTYYLHSITPNGDIGAKSYLYSYNKADESVDKSFYNINIVSEPEYINQLQNMLQSGSLISNSTYIQSVNIDRFTQVCYIDFSSDFMAKESLDTQKILLELIANTIGNYYTIENIIITVNGDNYNSQSDIIEPFKANLETIRR